MDSKYLAPAVLDQLNALTWITGTCHSCPSAYQPADARVTELEDQGYPNAPMSRYCRRCMGLRLQAEVDRRTVTRRAGEILNQRGSARMLHAIRERAHE